MNITEKTTIPIIFFVGALATAISVSLWLNNSLNDIKTQLSIIKYQLNGGVTESDFKLWLAELKNKNPTLAVPIFPPGYEKPTPRF